MFIKKSIKNSRGDTIVEVLIAIVVLSFVLTASYALANRSSQGVRQAQERSEALKYSQEQLEKLRNYNQSDTSWTGDCFPSGSDSPTTNPAQCGFGTDSRYKIKISFNAALNTYKLTASWDNVTGDGQDSLNLVYRLPSE